MVPLIREVCTDDVPEPGSEPRPYRRRRLDDAAAQPPLCSRREMLMADGPRPLGDGIQIRPLGSQDADRYAVLRAEALERHHWLSVPDRQATSKSFAIRSAHTLPTQAGSSRTGFCRRTARWCCAVISPCWRQGIPQVRHRGNVRRNSSPWAWHREGSPTGAGESRARVVGVTMCTSASRMRHRRRLACTKVRGLAVGQRAGRAPLGGQERRRAPHGSRAGNLSLSRSGDIAAGLSLFGSRTLRSDPVLQRAPPRGRQHGSRPSLARSEIRTRRFRLSFPREVCIEILRGEAAMRNLLPLNRKA